LGPCSYREKPTMQHKGKPKTKDTQASGTMCFGRDVSFPALWHDNATNDIFTMQKHSYGYSISWNE
jgi:hypothetical protein